MSGCLVLSQPKRLSHQLGVERFLYVRKGHLDFLRLAEVGYGVLNPNSALGEVLDRINKIHRMGYQE
jgi:hypothetical protein